MRVSTSQIYDQGIGGISRNQALLTKMQNQMSTGRRVVVPSDDPVASARSLIVTQSMEVNTRYLENQSSGRSSLGLVEGYTQSVTNLIHNARERVVQAGNTALTNSDRLALATELEARMQELVGLANTQDGAGQYLFSGYQGDTRPFSVDPTTGQVAYAGDSGERLLQMEASRLMPVNIAGDDLFMNARNGNGSFETRTGGNMTVNGAPPPSFNGNGINKGTATIDPGSVSDPSKWSDPANPGQFMIRFTVTVVAGVSTTTYNLYDNTVPATPVDLLGGAQPYVPGQTVALQKTTAPAADYGAAVTLSGTPSDGDSFTMARSTSQSLFKTVQNVINALKTPVGASYTPTQLSSDLAVELTNFNQNLDNVSRVQAKIGSRLHELDALSNTAQDVNLQYKSTISDLVDLDYAESVSDLSKQQIILEAAQKSFLKITGLGLFNQI